MKMGLTFKPQPLCNILNGIKTIEIIKSKRFASIVKKEIAKNGECRIECACAKSGGSLFLAQWGRKVEYRFSKTACVLDALNGETVCEIVVDKVGDVNVHGIAYNCTIDNNLMGLDELLEKSCLEYEDLDLYLEASEGYALHIKTVIPYKEV